MTGYSIRRLCIFAVLIKWGNYNDGVIYDKVKKKYSSTESKVVKYREYGIPV